MQVPEFIDADAPDFQARLVELHGIREHLDMLVFSAYAQGIEEFFRDHPEVVALEVNNGSDDSDNGRYAYFQAMLEVEGEEEEADSKLTDSLVDSVNCLRDRGIYDAFDEMFNEGRIEREDVMGQFGQFWANGNGVDAGMRWSAMRAAAEKAKLGAGTAQARNETGPAPRM